MNPTVEIGIYLFLSFVIGAGMTGAILSHRFAKRWEEAHKEFVEFADRSEEIQRLLQKQIDLRTISRNESNGERKNHGR